MHDAFEEIKSKFRDDFDSACNFYLKGVTTDDNRQLAKKYIKEIALVDNELKDREVRFLVLCKQAWGLNEFFYYTHQSFFEDFSLMQNSIPNFNFNKLPVIIILYF